MKFAPVLIGLISVFLLVSCHQKKRLNETEITQIAKEAYIYGYPIVENYRNMTVFAIDTQNPDFVKPFNELATLPVQQTSDVVVVETEEAIQNGRDEKIQLQTEISLKPGVDIAYGSAWLDLRREPLVVTIAPVNDKRYFSVQFIDLFGNDFDYFSNRKDGNQGGRLLVAAPGWKGIKPAGVSRIVISPSAFVHALFRIQLGNMTDAGKNDTVSTQYKIEPLSQYAGITPPPSPEPVDFPIYNSAKAKTPEFFTYLDFMLQFCTIPKEESGMMKRFAEIGIVPGKAFDYSTLSDSEKKALIDGMAAGQAELDAMSKTNVRIPVLYGNNSNLLKENYPYRAYMASKNLYGNSSEEIWGIVYEVSASNKRLNGKNRYELKFEKDELPPVNVFWSLTAYPSSPQSSAFIPYSAYAFSSNRQSYKMNEDGSLTLTLQQNNPGEEKQGNWMPVPEGRFFLLLQLYQPKEEVLKGQWPSPKIVRTNNSSVMDSASVKFPANPELKQPVLAKAAYKQNSENKKAQSSR